MWQLANYVDFFSTKNVFVRFEHFCSILKREPFPLFVTRPHFDQHANVILASSFCFIISFIFSRGSLRTLYPLLVSTKT